jgi:hypothetical protein
MTERYKAIPLTRWCFAIVDAENYEWLMQWKWRARYSLKTVYATRDEGRRHVHMHRVIMDAPDDVEVDHRDLNGLNNVASNLRLADRYGQNRNQGVSTHNKSGYKGVSWDKGLWRAQIMVRGEKIYLGRFPTPEEAARVYDAAALASSGEFAWVNFPEEH